MKKAGIAKNHGRFRGRSSSKSYISYNPVATNMSQIQPLPQLSSPPEKNISYKRPQTYWFSVS